jgi:galactokinase
MVDTACQAGALGAKINGSGEGGCIFAYAPGTSKNVAEALERLDTDTYIVNIDQGVCRDPENFKGEIS